MASAAIIAAPRQVVSTSWQAVTGRPVMSANIWQKSGLRDPPPVATNLSTGWPSPLYMASVSTRCSKASPSRTAR
jgi:hypothetical protein